MRTWLVALVCLGWSSMIAVEGGSQTTRPAHRVHKQGPSSLPRKPMRHRPRRPLNVQLARQGAGLYNMHCASCHHVQRRGLLASPLLPPFLRRTSDRRLMDIIAKGLPATQMPGFPKLGAQHIRAIVEYLRTPGQVHWQPQDILQSRTLSTALPRPLPIRQIINVTAVVERGKSLVWLMEGTRVLDRFAFGNVHGGIKFTADRSRLFVPSRDGWIGGYHLKEGRYIGKVRACVYTRNIAITRDSKFLLAACWMPKAIVVLDSTTLLPHKILPLRGQISAIYTFSRHDQAIFTFRDRPQLGLLHTKTWTISWHALPQPLSDFFLDPLERFVVGSVRGGRSLHVYDLEQKKIAFRAALEGMPHLFAATFWYKEGQFFFATPHMQLPYLTVWQMYQWRLVRKVPTYGHGFFVRTHPETPYLWADNGTDSLVLIHKHTFASTQHLLRKGKKVLHTEFSGDGKLAYISLFERQGALVMLDAITLEPRGYLPANIPVGKYNFINKQHRFESVQWGREVFMAKCWGCHHSTHAAFGPALTTIARARHPSWIRAQLLDPAITSQHLGYARNAMPKISLSSQEIDVLIEYISALGNDDIGQ